MRRPAKAWGFLVTVALFATIFFQQHSRAEHPGEEGPCQIAVEAIMRDKQAALQAGVKTIDRDPSLRCPANAHGKPFDYEASLAKIAHPLRVEEETSHVQYKTPLRLALSPDGEMFIADGYGNARIHKFSPDGELITSWGEPGAGPGHRQLRAGEPALCRTGGAR